MLRCGAAAAANNSGAGLQQSAAVCGKVLRFHQIAGLPLYHHGQPGIGADSDGKGARCAQLRQQSQHLFRAKAAVQADHVGAQALYHGGCGRDIRAGEQLPAFIKGQRHQYWQRGMLFGCQQRRFGFVDVAHGFNDDQVGPGVNLFGISSIGVLKIQIAVWFEQLSCGADVQRYPGTVRCCLFGQTHTGGNQLGRAGRPVLQLVAIGAESVGQENVGSGGAVGAVNVAQDFQMGDVPAFRQLARAEAPALQQRAHGTVKKHRTCIQRF